MHYLSFADGRIKTLSAASDDPLFALAVAKGYASMFGTPCILVRQSDHVIVASVIRDGAGGFKTIPATIVKQFK
jgi:hypothetical protein